jgi:hypothetical protein
MVDYAQQTHLASSEREEEDEVLEPHHQNAILEVEESSQTWVLERMRIDSNAHCTKQKHQTRHE